MPDELSALSAFAEVSGEAFGPELMPKGIPRALARGASFVGWLKARKPDSVLNENNLSMLLSSTLGKAPRMSCSKIAAGRIAFPPKAGSLMGVSLRFARNRHCGSN